MGGIKPEVYDVKRSLGFKLGDLSKRFKDVHDLRSLLTDHRPTDPSDYIDAYRKELDMQFEIVRQMNKIYQAGLSAGLSRSDILKAVTGEGLFKTKFNKQIQGLFGSKGPKFMASKPPIVFGAKMAKLIEDRTGVPVDTRTINIEIGRVYDEYMGRDLY